MLLDIHRDLCTGHSRVRSRRGRGWPVIRRHQGATCQNRGKYARSNVVLDHAWPPDQYFQRINNRSECNQFCPELKTKGYPIVFIAHKTICCNSLKHPHAFWKRYVSHAVCILMLFTEGNHYLVGLLLPTHRVVMIPVLFRP